MKVQQKAIEEMIMEIAGKDAAPIYKLLRNKKNVNEFDIANKLKLTINQIRNIIYKFEQYNLVSSHRKKDRKKGWYIYFFTFNNKQAEETVITIKKRKIEILKKQLDRESMHDFYMCTNKCVRLTIENAMEQNFMCNECNSLLVPEDKEKNVSRVNKQIKEIEEELKQIA